MARLSARFSRFFKPSRRSRSPTSSPSLKSMISKPILPGEDDSHTLLAPAHAHTHSHTSSLHTLSDAELQRLEHAQLTRAIADDIDSIIASYAHLAPTSSRDTFADTQPYYDAASAATSAAPESSRAHCSPAPSSVYSSPASSPASSPGSSPPARVRARLERFRDTPPPAPGWDRVSFGRETGLFGPDVFADLADSGARSAPRSERFRDEADEQRAGRRKDWRGEFARRGVGGRGYAGL